MKNILIDLGKKFDDWLDSQSAFQKKTLLAVISLLLVTVAGWFGDALKGDCLFRRNCEGWDWISITTALFIYLLLMWPAYRIGRKLMDVKVLARSGTLKQKSAMICFVSIGTVPIKGSDGWIIKKDGKTYRLTGQLSDDIDIGLKDSRHPLQQILRAVLPHKSIRHFEVLYTSASKNLIDSYKQILTEYFPDISIDERETNFEDLDVLLADIDRSIKNIRRKKISEADMIIDVTGGQKTASIAAAITSMKYENMEFQYVSTATCEVWQFNATGQQDGVEN